ncbi:hypothetical protein [Megasphaera sp.]|uniref:hypothetical protein n=1 Tax=Megasphaera sp. TaxID=2023260 RepID=UPI003522539B
MSNFVLTSTLIEPKMTEIKTGPEAQLYEMINQNEEQYGVKEKYWTKDLIDKRSHDIASLMYNILIKKI